MHLTQGSSHVERVTPSFIAPGNSSFFTHVQEGEQKAWGIPVSLPANPSPPVHGRHHHHLSNGLSHAFTTLYQHEYQGLGSPRPAPDHDKPWQGRAGEVFPHVASGQAAGLRSHHTQPTCSGCSQHQPSSWLWSRDFLVSAYKTLWGKQDQQQHWYDPSVPTPPVHNQFKPIWDHIVTQRCGPAYSLPWLHVSSCSLVSARLVVQLPAGWICLMDHFSARLTGWPASPWGSTVSHSGSGRNAQPGIGLSGMGQASRTVPFGSQTELDWLELLMKTCF